MRIPRWAGIALLMTMAVATAQDAAAPRLVEAKLVRGDGTTVTMKEAELASYRLISERNYLDLLWLTETQRFGRRAPGPSDAQVVVYGGRGVYPASLVGIVRRLRGAEISCRIAFGDDFDPGQARLVIVPGGWAPSMAAALGEPGLARLRERKLRYLGICAGAYLACDTVRWEGRDYPYPVGRARGRAEGPLSDIAVWPSAAPVELELEPGPGPSSKRGRKRECAAAIYVGGATFDVRGAKVRARYPGGRPAIIEGDGWILTGAHIEFDAREDKELLAREGLPRSGDGRLFVALVRELLE